VSGVTEAELGAIEDWFGRRGVPHFVERRESIWDDWGRAIPLLVPAYLLLGLNALDLAHWSVAANLGAAAFVIAALVATWMLSNVARGRPAAQRPRDVGPIEVAILLVVPALASAVFGQWGDALETLLLGAGLLAAVLAVNSYGLVALTGWIVARGIGQLAAFGNVAVRALPLLLMFTTFLFINAEVWQVAGTLDGPVYLVVLAMFVALGALFLLSRLPRLLQGVDAFATWHDVGEAATEPPAAAAVYLAVALDPDAPPPPSALRGRQRFNVALVGLFPQAMQVALAAITITVFFVGFGVAAIPAATAASWTQTDVHTLVTWHVAGRDLALTEPLIRVSAFLGAFTGMYFTVVLSTDATYREEFAEDTAPGLRGALAVRRLYRAALTRQ